MIPNQWYPIFESRLLGRRAVAIKRANQKLVLFRGTDGEPRCLLDRCPHRGAELSRGQVRGNEIACHFHGLRFNGQGQCVMLPCEGPQARIPAALEADALTVQDGHGLVWMWWGAKPAALGRDELPPLPWFNDLPEFASSSIVSQVLPGNQIRWTESSFDIQHGGFVHGSPVQKFGTLVGKTELRVDDDPNRFEFKTDLVPETGTRQQVIDMTMSFIPPSIVLNVYNGELPFMDKPPFIAIMSDCPVDEDHTWRCIQQYVRPSWKIPGLAKLAALLFLQGMWVFIKLEDLPAVQSQFSPPELDHLLRPDIGIACYRKIRHRLQQEALQQEVQLPPLVRNTLHQTLASEALPRIRTNA